MTTAALVVAPATAQCPLQLLPGPQLSGTDDTVLAFCEWDPDGAGPRTPVVVAGGSFIVAGSVIANRIAAYDPITSTWSSFGAGMNGTVWALAVLPSGDLVAAGAFTTADGNPVNRIARWDGSAWSPLGAGVSGVVRAMTVLTNGDLVAAGEFASAGGATANNIARWDSLSWSPLGSGMNAGVFAVATMPNGDLIAGGAFGAAGGVPASRVARWDGLSWSAVGAGTTSRVSSLAVRPNGFLVVSVQPIQSPLPPIQQVPVVLEWDGSAWTALLTTPSNLAQLVPALTILPSGEVVVGGLGGVRSWNGTSWSILGTASYVIALTVLANGTLVAGGDFTTIGGTPAENVGLWNGAAWSATGPAPVHSTVLRPILPLANGDMVFTTYLGVTSTKVVRWNGSTLSQVGAAFPAGSISNLALHPTGDIIAVGSFISVGGAMANLVARWNGTAWLPLGSGVPGAFVDAVTVMPNGDIVIGGTYTATSRWDGTTWSPLMPSLDGIRTLMALPNGDLIAGCSVPAPSGVMRWDGTSWSPLGALPHQVWTLALLPDGDIVAGGAFSSGALARIARWDGTAWLPLGSGIGSSSNEEVREIKVLPNGDLIAVGNFATAGGIAVSGAARWNGIAWSPVVSSVSGLITSVGIPQQGGVVLGGGFSTIDGQVSAHLAWLDPTCPAGATPSGIGCPSSGGANVLGAQSLPWVGATFEATATGLPANALALDLLGTATTAIPLPLILPQGGAGCSLLVGPDVVQALLPVAGSVATELTIPNSVSLAGAVLHEQVIALDFGTGSGIVAVTSTNRLTLTIGAF